jgi:hypothetical protein
MKNITRILILLLTVPVFFAAAQAPSLQWQKSFGGSENDFAFSIKQITDGGFIVAGQTASSNGNVTGNHGDEDFWVVRLDKSGNIKWQKALGGTADDGAFATQQTIDGGFIVAGEAASSNGNVTGNHGNLDFWVVKLTANGNITWQKSLGGSNADFATSVQQTNDLGYIVAGGSNSSNGDVTGHHGTASFLSDYWVVKLDANGNLQWQKSLGGTAGEIAYSVQQTSEGGYIVAGNSESNNGDVTGMHDIVYGDFWIVKLDKSGNIEWQKSLGGTDYDQANSIKQTADGGYIAAGFSRSNNGDVTNAHGNYDVWMTKLDGNGNLVWQKTYGGSVEDFGYGVEQTPDGGYVLSGGTASNDGDASGNHGNEDFWVLKTDAAGNLQWQSELGGSSFDEGKSINQTSEGGYVAAGYSESNNGNVSGNHGQRDFWVVKLFSCNCIPPIAGFKTTTITSSSAVVKWDTVACVTGYKVHYRVAGTTAWTTKDLNANKGMKKLIGLAPSTEYEWQIASKCSGTTVSNYSPIQTFTTLPLRNAGDGELSTTSAATTLFLSPNPSSEMVHLRVTGAQDVAQLLVFDVSGKVMMQQNVPAESGGHDIDLNIAQLPAGIYYVTIKSESGLISAKLVKE